MADDVRRIPTADLRRSLGKTADRDGVGEPGASSGIVKESVLSTVTGRLFSEGGVVPLAADSGGLAVTPQMLVVFAIILFALVLFITEWLPIDVTAILIMVLLMILGADGVANFTEISTTEGTSGFSNSATITVLAMLILSSGISQTGVVQIIGRKMSAFAGEDLDKQLLATIGVSGPISGFINNTPVVAILVPVVSDIAHKGKTSPSKLLIPLSYASMFGGMLTLIGTSTNILASDVSARLLDHPFSMFEFTKLGVIVLLVGSIYLMTVGHRLLPERVPVDEDYVTEYAIGEYLTEAIVDEGSPIVGSTVADAIDRVEFDADILQVVRDGEEFIEPIGQKTIRAGDTLRLRADRPTVQQLVERETLTIDGGPETDAELEPDEIPDRTLVEVVVPRGSFLVGESLETSTFRQRYDATVLAFRSRGETVRSDMDERRIRVGDTLLVQAAPDSIDRLSQNDDFIVAHEPDEPDYRTEKIPHAAAIMAGVVGFVAVPWGAVGSALAGVTGVGGFEAMSSLSLPIMVTALAGVVAMVATGVLKPTEIYDAVEWDVIFLLAGIIPLGMALEQTGGADLLGSLVASTGAYLPVLGVLWVFYLATGLITGVISNNASVVLMLPVAVQTADQIGANPFAFVLAVTFAASTAFLTPVGYQTNLFVYGPGGYKFTDFVRVGAPLQLLLSIVTVLGIAFFWGL
ncbi:TrkA-C domain protein [Natrinema pellirubrum DSM 15624]|uniref:Di-/tricarboxylate transporter n=2 Tax=Natrinema pellirubrum TaxID=69525 RepID=L0JSJ3_NATP1|nr:di-/tricarboxylate transporter [Natrinema pellirubrum DSM 15624]ELY70484.1 TrkA-C domain protein [Natrinema pellirubrum DSM 15624]